MNAIIFLAQKAFGAAFRALLFVCTCVKLTCIIIHAILGIVIDAMPSSISESSTSVQLKSRDSGLTVMPGPKDGDEVFKVGSDEAEIWPAPEVIAQFATSSSKATATPLHIVPLPDQVRKGERSKILLRQLAAASSSGPSKTQSGKGIPPYTSTMVKNTVPPTAEKRERHRRLRALVNAAFPDGQTPDPYTSVPIRKYDDDDAIKGLQSVQASLEIYADVDDEYKQSFSNIWCLWDTGAQTSQILSSQLNADVRLNQNSGVAMMTVKFSGVEHEFESVIAFREHMPNDTTFIILGQHGLLNRIEYRVQPQLVNPLLRSPQVDVYGQLELITYADPVFDDLNIQPTPL